VRDARHPICGAELATAALLVTLRSTGPQPAVHNTGPIPAIGYEDEYDDRAPDDTSPQGITPGQGG